MKIEILFPNVTVGKIIELYEVKTAHQIKRVEIYHLFFSPFSIEWIAFITQSTLF